MFLNLVYLLGLLAAAPWLVFTAITKGKYRRGWTQKLFGLVPRAPGISRPIWLHAVSVGEVNLLVPLVRELSRPDPAVEVVISTTTDAGFKLAQTRFPDRLVFYFPLDFTWAVGRAIRRLQPRLLVLTELELWPNLVTAAREIGVPVAVVNGRLSERSFRGYRRIVPLLRPTLARIDLVAAQNECYAERFRALGAEPSRVHVTGSMKYDNARANREDPTVRALGKLAGIRERDIVFLAGSTGEPEEEIALTAYERVRAKHPKLRLVLVPRHPERFAAVAELLQERGCPFVRRTHLDTAASSEAAPAILVDKVGELGQWWGLANIGFVGGSLNRRGGQNMIEPAAYGVATCFGPNTHNFRDIVADLLRHDAARVVRDMDELTAFVQECVEQPEFRGALGERARRFVLTQRGATAETVRLLEPFLTDVPSARRDAA